MKFQVGNETFFLTFKREHRNITFQRGGRTKTRRSQHPFTTATLLELNGLGQKTIVCDYSVGCAPEDYFSKERGRIEALRGLGKMLTKQVRTAMWQAYIVR
jgi:hypothetical protein